MGKRKRSKASYEEVLKKIKRLTSKLKKRSRSSSSSSASSKESGRRQDAGRRHNRHYNHEDYFTGDEVINIDDGIDPEQYLLLSDQDQEQVPTGSLAPVSDARAASAEPPSPAAPTAPADLPAPSTTSILAMPSTSSASPVPAVAETLEPEILQLLGNDPTSKEQYGVDLHKDIALRWAHILTNGLPKESQVELIKSYLPPRNCPNMAAPKLNPEIKAALAEINIKKDLYSQSKQNQLANSLAAIGQVLNWALSSNSNVPQEIIKTLSDAGRLICDSHYKESLSRRYAAVNTLNKNIRDTVRNTKIDEHLFGSSLADHIKSSKSISKTGLEMKPATSRPTYKAPTATFPQRGALNLKGAPRVPPPAEPRPTPAPRRPPRDRRSEAPRGRRPAGHSRHHARKY